MTHQPITIICSCGRAYSPGEDCPARDDEDEEQGDAQKEKEDTP